MTRRRNLTIAGLGPAGPDLITQGTLAAIEEADVIRLRTSRHPGAEPIRADSYDHFYENAETFDDVYSGIVEDLVDLAGTSERVLYLVPGSPVVAETTVERLIADDRVECRVMAAMSFLDLSWVRLGIDPVNLQVLIVDGHNFGTEVDGIGHRIGGSVTTRRSVSQLTGPMLVAQCSSRAVLSNIKLAAQRTPETAILLHHLGLGDEQIVTVPWAEIDRTLEADHLTSLYIPRVTTPGARRRFGFGTLKQVRRGEQ